MVKRWFVLSLILLGATLALGLNVGRATAEEGTPLPTPGWHRGVDPALCPSARGRRFYRLLPPGVWHR